MRGQDVTQAPCPTSVCLNLAHEPQFPLCESGEGTTCHMSLARPHRTRRRPQFSHLRNGEKNSFQSGKKAERGFGALYLECTLEKSLDSNCPGLPGGGRLSHSFLPQAG